jgi:hypothetical protein
MKAPHNILGIAAGAAGAALVLAATAAQAQVVQGAGALAAHRSLASSRLTGATLKAIAARAQGLANYYRAYGPEGMDLTGTSTDVGLIGKAVRPGERRRERES